MKPTDFKDHFSKAAAAYAEFRPSYPEALFAWLASVAPGHDQAWDAGTGNGQAAVGLARHFRHVEATDPSAPQIAAAKPDPRVTYRLGRDTDSGLPAASCDLVTVAQALHWFDVPRFFQEAARVLKPRGVLAAWTYLRPALDDPEANVVLQEYVQFMERWWPPERAIVESGYRTIAFPFEEIAPPALELELQPLREELLGYLRTWSAWKRYMESHEVDPVAVVEQRLAVIWPAGLRLRLSWQLAMRAGHRPASLHH